MRTSEQILSELQTIELEILKGIPDNDISLMLTTLSILTTRLASSASLVAEAGALYNQRKVKAYRDLLASQHANESYWSASQGRDYVSALCGQDKYVLDLADRINSAVVHTIDALRTAISAEKQMLSNLR